MKKMKNKNILALNLTLIVLLLVGLTSSAGISLPYWKDHPLEMNYGDTKIVDLNLQNMVGNDDITVDVAITQGSDIAKLEQTRYTAKAGTSDTIIPIIIKVPSNYDKNLQTVEVEVKTVNSDQGGMVNLGTGWKNSFNVILSEKPVTAGNLMAVIVGLIIAIIVLAIIIFILIRRKRK